MPAKTAKLIILSIFYLFASKLAAQDIPTFTQFFTNPYMYNPAYAGLEGRSTFVLTHRRQWVGINDAPVTTNFLYHTALKLGVNLGANVTQDEAGIFKTTSGLLTFGYTVGLGWNHFLSFGISGGAAFNNLNLNEGVNLNDPALAGVLDNSISLKGNAGIAYHISNFNIGFALPKLFKTATYSTVDFDKGEFDALSNFIVTADYMIYFADGHNALEPYFLYRSYQEFPAQFEGGAIFHYQDVFWLGGGYRQDFGYMALLGLKLKGLVIGYAYELSSTNVSGVNTGTHEIQLSLSLGEKNKRSKKHSTFLASQQVTKPEKEKKEKKTEEVIVAKTVEPEETKEEIPEDTTPVVVTDRPKTEETGDETDTKEHVETDTKERIEPDTRQPGKTESSVRDAEGPAVVVARGNHPFELEKGHYVVVGTFSVIENAVRMNDRLATQGLDTRFGYSTAKKLFYVFLYKGTDSTSAREARNNLRKTDQFKEVWYLLVE